MTMFEERREGRRQFLRRNFLWLVPLGLIAGAGMFIGLGQLVAWLWRVTLGDIFGFKPISFWQAWGLMLLSQILFKANMRRTMPTGPRFKRPEHA
jgi:succinate-acetate transporter protein